jgi:ubiquinone/menaquinone biosynthesis C-methylase UbiE
MKSSGNRKHLKPQKIAKLYDRIAESYDTYRWLCASPAAEEKLNSIFRERITTESQVLELAPGTGINIRRLFECSRGFKSYLGIDISSAMLDQARKQAGDDSRIEFRQADVTNISNIDGNYNFIVSTWLLSHLSDPEVTVARVLDCLLPGGTAVFLFWSCPDNKLYLRWLTWFMGLFQCAPVYAEVICTLPQFEAKFSFQGGAQTLVIFRRPLVDNNDQT